MRYKVFDTESKVLGQVVVGFKAASDKSLIEPILEKHNLVDVQPDQWYPLQNWLDVLNDVAEQAGDYQSMITFVNVGTKVMASIYLPDVLMDEMEDVGFVEFINRHGEEVYHRDHQGDVGDYKVEKLDEKHLKLTIRSPYPADFWYGIAYGMAKRFSKTPFVAQFEDISMRSYDNTRPYVIHVIFE